MVASKRGRGRVRSGGGSGSEHEAVHRLRRRVASALGIALVGAPLDAKAGRAPLVAGVPAPSLALPRRYEPLGRPLRHQGEIVTTSFREGDGWPEPLAGDAAAPIDAATRARLAAHFEHAALVEHSSIAAFAKLSIDLLALGAPAELVARAHAIALDEIAHARAMCGLASAAAGTPREPGPLPIPPPSPAGVEQLVVDTITDACFGESLGAAEGFLAAESCERPAWREALRRIADDELDHATFGFELLGFLLRLGGDAARHAAACATGALGELEDARPVDDDLRRFGVIDREGRARVRANVLATVVAPAVSAVVLRSKRDAEPPRLTLV